VFQKKFEVGLCVTEASSGMQPCRLMALVALFMGCLAAPAKRELKRYDSPKVHARIPFLLKKFNNLVGSFTQLKDEIEGFKKMGYLPPGKSAETEGSSPMLNLGSFLNQGSDSNGLTETADGAPSPFDKLQRMAALREKFLEQTKSSEEGKTGSIVVQGDERPVEQRPVELPIEMPVQKTTKAPTQEDVINKMKQKIKMAEKLKEIRARYEKAHPEQFSRHGYDNRLYPPRGRRQNDIFLRPSYLSRRRRSASRGKRSPTMREKLTKLVNCVKLYRKTMEIAGKSTFESSRASINKNANCDQGDDEYYRRASDELRREGFNTVEQLDALPLRYP